MLRRRRRRMAAEYTYVYTYLEVFTSKDKSKPYVFEIVAINSRQLQEAIDDAIGIAAIFSHTDLGDEENFKVKWSGEQPITDLKQLLRDVGSREGLILSQKEIEDELDSKGWAYLDMP